MPSWSGWEAQFLDAAHLPNVVKNRAFLNDWQTHSTSECGNNPIDVSRRMPGSVRCFALPGTAGYAQRYTTHAQAASAFNLQLHNGQFPALLNAFKSRAPYEVGNPDAVERDLVRWGSGIFELAYRNQVTTPPPPPPTGGTGAAPHVMKGWGDVQRQVNQALPNTLRRVDKLSRHSLSALGRKRRVRR